MTVVVNVKNNKPRVWHIYKWGCLKIPIYKPNGATIKHNTLVFHTIYKKGQKIEISMYGFSDNVEDKK